MAFKNAYLSLPGSNNNSASVPDAAPLDITGDIDIIVKVQMPDYSPAVQPFFMSKWGAEYQFGPLTDGRLSFRWHDGAALQNPISTVNITGVTTDGEDKWFRMTTDMDNGAGDTDTIFYYGDNGTDWTQLGDTVNTGAASQIRVGTAAIFIGSQAAASAHMIGRFYRLIVKDGIDGTIVLDVDFTDPALIGETSFTEDSSNAATVTVNQSGDPQAEIVGDELVDSNRGLWGLAVDVDPVTATPPDVKRILIP